MTISAHVKSVIFFVQLTGYVLVYPYVSELVRHIHGETEVDMMLILKLQCGLNISSSFSNFIFLNTDLYWNIKVILYRRLHSHSHSIETIYYVYELYSVYWSHVISKRILADRLGSVVVKDCNVWDSILQNRYTIDFGFESPWNL